MKTTEQLITEGAEYFNKCGKHLFRIHSAQAVHNYKYVGLMIKDGIDYRVKILFQKNDTNVKVSAFKMTSFPINKAEYSQNYFPQNEKLKAVRQNKYLKRILDEIKAEAFKRITDDDRGNYHTFTRKMDEVEKSGV